MNGGKEHWRKEKERKKVRKEERREGRTIEGERKDH
jgi:hypothetical protein